MHSSRVPSIVTCSSAGSGPLTQRPVFPPRPCYRRHLRVSIQGIPGARESIRWAGRPTGCLDGLSAIGGLVRPWRACPPGAGRACACPALSPSKGASLAAGSVAAQSPACQQASPPQAGKLARQRSVAPGGRPKFRNADKGAPMEIPRKRIRSTATSFLTNSPEDAYAAAGNARRARMVSYRSAAAAQFEGSEAVRAPSPKGVGPPMRPPEWAHPEG